MPPRTELIQLQKSKQKAQAKKIRTRAGRKIGRRGLLPRPWGCSERPLGRGLRLKVRIVLLVQDSPELGVHLVPHGGWHSEAGLKGYTSASFSQRLSVTLRM